MSEKRYFWLKLYDDFFTSKRIKKLRSIAGGDTYTIIYLKMQLKALKTEGYLYFDGVMTDFAEELALDLDENPDDVRVTIQFLQSVGLLETNNDEDYKLTYMDKLIGSENASAQRVRDHRAKQKALQCNTDVTEVKRVGNAEIDIEIEKDIDIESGKKRKRFVPPTIEEVQAYCQERKNNVDPKRFFDYYEQGGWKDSKGNPVKNWKQKLITWENKEPKTEQKKHFGNERTNIDFEALKKSRVCN